MADIAGWSLSAIARLHQGHDLVLVTVVRSQGSAPRGAGAKLWVNATDVSGTIGGGHLEYTAIAHARQLLRTTGHRVREIQRYALGPSLGQCCGGVVWLAYERLTVADTAWCDQITASLDSGQPIAREVDFNDLQKTVSLVRVQAPEADFETDYARWNPADNVLFDTIAPGRLCVVVCGAGHVGQAIVNLLGTLPVQVIWLDPRDGVWPETLPSNVRCLQGDEADVVDCPDNACWLVLSHSHALDLAIVQAVMAHKPFRFLG